VAVDLQVDVDAPLPDEAEWVRLCITDGVHEEFGAGDGRYALPGVEADPELTVQVLDEQRLIVGGAGPVLVDEDHHVVPYLELGCDGGHPVCSACEGEGRPPPEGEPSWVLGLRFR